MIVDKTTVSLQVGETTNIQVSEYGESFTVTTPSGATHIITSISVPTGLIVITGLSTGEFTLSITSGEETVTVTGEVTAAQSFIELSDDFTDPLSDSDRSIFNRQTAINRNIKMVLETAQSSINILKTVQNHLIAVEVITGVNLASSLAAVGLAIANLTVQVKGGGKDTIDGPNRR